MGTVVKDARQRLNSDRGQTHRCVLWQARPGTVLLTRGEKAQTEFQESDVQIEQPLQHHQPAPRTPEPQHWRREPQGQNSTPHDVCTHSSPKERPRAAREGPHQRAKADTRTCPQSVLWNAADNDKLVLWGWQGLKKQRQRQKSSWSEKSRPTDRAVRGAPSAATERE